MLKSISFFLVDKLSTFSRHMKKWIILNNAVIQHIRNGTSYSYHVWFLRKCPFNGGSNPAVVFELLL
jgi:hypothetical protein